MNKGLTPLDYFIALGQTCLMQSRNYKNNEVVVLKNGEKHTTKELGGIVETALKDHETLKREHEFLREHYNELLKDYNDLKTREFSKEQALSIIKKCMKGNVDLFLWEHEVVGKGTVYYCFGKKVTKSQYDFLMRLLS